VTAVLVVLGGYLLGSMPFGYWLVRVAKGEDVRRHGSGSIGASNVWRTSGKAYGIPVVVLDIAKGAVPAFVGTAVAGELVGVLAGGAAMLGHWRPLFLRFQKGGKMVATAAGTFFGVVPAFGLLGAGVWLVVFVVTRYTSVASIVTGLVLPVLALVLGESWPVVVFTVLAGAFVVYLHRPNIERLRAGTETRFRLRGRARAAS
jgi:glycerol-3-phosphate acyltransferase PlsY